MSSNGRVFVFGVKGYLFMTAEEPTTELYEDGTYRWGLASRWNFAARHGALVEKREPVHGHVYAREVGADAALSIAEIDGDIVTAEMRLGALHAKRQELLLVAAKHGKKVRVRKRTGRKRRGQR